MQAKRPTARLREQRELPIRCGVPLQLRAEREREWTNIIGKQSMDGHDMNVDISVYPTPNYY